LCSFQDCIVCGRSGAAITCKERGCEHSFHLPCVTKGECISQHFEEFRRPWPTSFLLPQVLLLQALPTAGSADCLLCLEDAGDRRSYATMVCVACGCTWFHRDQVGADHAVRAGTSAFQHLLCRDRTLFQQEMLRMGTRISRRLVSFLPSTQDRRVQMLCQARGSPCTPGLPLSCQAALELHRAVENRARAKAG
ncbi:G2E3 ligase, partial [Psilopogon haemacephalus]|nr:G2E3 ligase [Psilopogon haemacephalus]